MSVFIGRGEAGIDLFAVEAPDLDSARVSAREGATVIPQAQHPRWSDYLEYCRWGGAGGPLGTFVQYLNRRRAQDHRFAVNRRTGETRDQPTLEDIRASAIPFVEV